MPNASNTRGASPMHYVLLMRHGTSQSKSYAPRPPEEALTTEDREQVEEVASKLKEFIAETTHLPDHRFTLKQIWSATTPEAGDTARIMHTRLVDACDITQVENEVLSPKHTSPYGSAGKHQSLIDNIIKHFKDDPEPGNALLIVGHQPILGWIAEELTGEAYPIERAELLCLRFAGEPRRYRRTWRHRFAGHQLAVLRWVLTPVHVSGTDPLTELKEKISGKMEGAKLLGTFTTAILGFMLNTLIDKTKISDLGPYGPVLVAAALAFFLAILLYFASYYAYDRLLMPIRFWSASAPVDKNHQPDWLVMRPPSSALWVLYQNMMHIWQYLFTPAVVLVCAGLVLLGFIVFRPEGGYLITAIILSVVVGVSFKPLYRRLGPRLGSQD
jgi:phosphohistidine phosphatase SixA